MTKYSVLFSEGKIGNLKTKNRLVMPPMVLNYADEMGLVTPKYLAHIERIACGGVGGVRSVLTEDDHPPGWQRIQQRTGSAHR